MSSGDYIVLPPVMFNRLKHHAGYIRHFINSLDLSACEQVNSLSGELNAIGKSQMDLYTGGLMPRTIAGEITGYLKDARLIGREDYLSWLHGAKHKYREITLSDGSVWVLLPGVETERHVHIHPGRYSPHSIRVRSETLKTAIAAICYSRQHGRPSHDTGTVNEARTKLLGLSPIRDIERGKGIGKLIGILCTDDSAE